MDKQNSQTGLRVKYDVKKVETGETVNNCFVLRPDKDPAAVVALRTYARVTPNKALADDIITWVGAEPADKPLSEWTLGEAKAECRGRTPTGFDKNKACVGCPLNGKVCDDCENVFFPFAPEDWKIDGETEAKTEREGLGPSPTGETEGPAMGVGAGSKPARPRLAEVLGVEVGERFQVDGAAGEFWVESDGGVKSSWTAPSIPPITRYILYAINHPESIIRAPRLTESEIAIMRAVGAKWVSRNINNGVDCAVICAAVYLWREKPSSNIGLYFADGGPIATVNDPDIFSSVKPGECIGVEEAER